jgi:HAMP domain-containing protein
MTGLWSRLPLAGKMFVVCMLLALTASSVGNVLFYREASKCLRAESRHRLSSLASTIASQVSPSLHSRIRTRTDEQSPAYLQIKSLLRKARLANPDIRYVYTMRPTNNGKTWRFIVDSEDVPRLKSHVGDICDAESCPDMGRALLTPTADSVPTKDRWGTWLSGFAPIRNGRGRAEAIVGVDLSVAELAAAQAGLERARATNVLVCIVLAVALGLLATRAGVKVLRTFGQAAERVQTGDLDFQLDASRADEIGKFAETFNQMILGLRQSRDRMKESTAVDLMTGLANHVCFHERLEYEIEQ